MPAHKYRCFKMQQLRLKVIIIEKAGVCRPFCFFAGLGPAISGVQLKYSLRMEEGQLVLADRDGVYILKPILPSRQYSLIEQAPENEHLTMQIAGRCMAYTLLPIHLCTSRMAPLLMWA